MSCWRDPAASASGVFHPSFWLTDARLTLWGQIGPGPKEGPSPISPVLSGLGCLTFTVSVSTLPAPGSFGRREAGIPSLCKGVPGSPLCDGGQQVTCYCHRLTLGPPLRGLGGGRIPTREERWGWGTSEWRKAGRGPLCRDDVCGRELKGRLRMTENNRGLSASATSWGTRRKQKKAHASTLPQESLLPS